MQDLHLALGYPFYFDVSICNNLGLCLLWNINVDILVIFSCKYIINTQILIFGLLLMECLFRWEVVLEKQRELASVETGLSPLEH